MKRVLMLVTTMGLAFAWPAAAETPTEGRGAGDAPRLLAEALRTGRAEPEAIGAIVRWVLEAREEDVASGFGEALRAVVMPEGSPTAVGPEAERWHAAARGVIAAFEGLLGDAQAHRRRDGESVLRDLEPVFRAAAPAVADALRETDPEIAEGVLRALRFLSPPPPER